MVTTKKNKKITSLRKYRKKTLKRRRGGSRRTNNKKSFITALKRARNKKKKRTEKRKRRKKKTKKRKKKSGGTRKKWKRGGSTRRNEHQHPDEKEEAAAEEKRKKDHKLQREAEEEESNYAYDRMMKGEEERQQNILADAKIKAKAKLEIKEEYKTEKAKKKRGRAARSIQAVARRRAARKKVKLKRESALRWKKAKMATWETSASAEKRYKWEKAKKEEKRLKTEDKDQWFFGGVYDELKQIYLTPTFHKWYKQNKYLIKSYQEGCAKANIPIACEKQPNNVGCRPSPCINAWLKLTKKEKEKYRDYLFEEATAKLPSINDDISTLEGRNNRILQLENDLKKLKAMSETTKIVDPDNMDREELKAALQEIGGPGFKYRYIDMDEVKEKIARPIDWGGEGVDTGKEGDEESDEKKRVLLVKKKWRELMKDNPNHKDIMSLVKGTVTPRPKSEEEDVWNNFIQKHEKGGLKVVFEDTHRGRGGNNVSMRKAVKKSKKLVEEAQIILLRIELKNILNMIEKEKFKKWVIMGKPSGASSLPVLFVGKDNKVQRGKITKSELESQDDTGRYNIIMPNNKEKEVKEEYILGAGDRLKWWGKDPGPALLVKEWLLNIVKTIANFKRLKFYDEDIVFRPPGSFNEWVIELSPDQKELIRNLKTAVSKLKKKEIAASQAPWTEDARQKRKYIRDREKEIQYEIKAIKEQSIFRDAGSQLIHSMKFLTRKKSEKIKKYTIHFLMYSNLLDHRHPILYTLEMSIPPPPPIGSVTPTATLPSPPKKPTTNLFGMPSTVQPTTATLPSPPKKTTTNLFGVPSTVQPTTATLPSPPKKTTTNLFGVPSTVQPTTATLPSPPKKTTTNLFGVPSTVQPTTATNLFGKKPTTPAAPPASSLFGTPAKSKSLFSKLPNKGGGYGTSLLTTTVVQKALYPSIPRNVNIGSPYAFPLTKQNKEWVHIEQELQKKMDSIFQSDTILYIPNPLYPKDKSKQIIFTIQSWDWYPFSFSDEYKKYDTFFKKSPFKFIIVCKNAKGQICSEVDTFKWNLVEKEKREAAEEAKKKSKTFPFWTSSAKRTEPPPRELVIVTDIHLTGTIITAKEANKKHEEERKRDDALKKKWKAEGKSDKEIEALLKANKAKQAAAKKTVFTGMMKKLNCNYHLEELQKILQKSEIIAKPPLTPYEQARDLKTDEEEMLAKIKRQRDQRQRSMKKRKKNKRDLSSDGNL